MHVVLPFARAEFVEESVAPAGEGWVERFDRCLDSAASVRYATDDAYRGDEVLFRYGSELAMGLALLRARYLDADVQQLAVWDREPARGAAGTAIDVATWLRRGGSVTLVQPPRNPPCWSHRGDSGHAASAPAGSDREPTLRRATSEQPGSSGRCCSPT